VTTSPTCGRSRRLQVNGLDLRLHELPGAFHHLVLDDPAGFVARVESWLATLPAGQRPA